MAMTPARKAEIEMNNRERKAQQARKELEDMYQSMAGLISQHAYSFHVYDDQYPKLVIKNDVDGKKYEIIIKEVK